MGLKDPSFVPWFSSIFVNIHTDIQYTTLPTNHTQGRKYRWGRGGGGVWSGDKPPPSPLLSKVKCQIIVKCRGRGSFVKSAKNTMASGLVASFIKSNAIEISLHCPDVERVYVNFLF